MLLGLASQSANTFCLLEVPKNPASAGFLLYLVRDYIIFIYSWNHYRKLLECVGIKMEFWSFDWGSIILCGLQEEITLVGTCTHDELRGSAWTMFRM